MTVLNYGDTAAREVSKRIGRYGADAAALKAIPANARVNGQLFVKVDDASLWLFNGASSASAGATVLVPDAGSGRFLQLSQTIEGLTALLASASTGAGASLVSIEDAATQIAATQVEGALAELAAKAVQKRTVTVGHADLTDAVNGEAQVLNVGTALPANAVVLGHDVFVTTLFSGGSVSAVTVDIGGTDADAIVDGMDVFTGAATGALTGTAGVHPRGKFSSQQLTATFLPDGGHTLLALSAGALTITVWFFVLA